MSTDDLNQAIELIQAGQLEQAQPLLEAVLQGNPQDLTAWSWYARTCRTPEKRIEALEVCLRFNPGNADVSAALEKLRAKVAAAQPAAPAPVAAFYEPESSAQADSGLGSYAALAMAAPTTTGIAQTEAAAEHKGLDDNPERAFGWFDVWVKALTQPNVAAYEALIRDPSASLGRACWWMFIAEIIAGAVTAPFIYMRVMEQIKLLGTGLEPVSLGANTNAYIILAMVWYVPIAAGLSVVSLILGGAILNLIAKWSGGKCNLARTVYLIGAYTAPLSMLSSIVALIPLVNCLAIVLAFYQFRLNVIALQVAHRMPSGRAIIVVLIPGLLLIMGCCVAGAAAGPAFQQALRSSLPH